MSVISDLVNKGELPKVTVEVKISKENMIDLAAIAVIAALVVLLISRTLLKNL
ncbi:hypothetical protein [Pedobacter jeongneungensis]|uniref:hypothetical protein n=1 Tax=Pedobacter TaxID=84567 RepID=UPI000ABAC53B|nr:hypothetical protein [Pedobacter jeongneungensis]